MGFAVYYRSTRPVAPTESEAIREAASAANEGRTWLSCEPVHFFPDDDRHLMGGSKPNFVPHPDDAAAAAREVLPDGTTRDLLDILCQLSRDHRIDWKISHDYSERPIGYIRGGVCDGDVLAQLEAFADLGDLLGDLVADSGGGPGGFPASASRDSKRGGDEDDEGPSILPFRPKGK